jgi:predicted regulator of Ras-like GTPase activity (Roadblock/LC7/MglB family)
VINVFERFTEKAIKTIMLAQEEARRLGHNFVGTEQILLGLIGEGTGIASRVLKAAGLTLKEARIEVEKIIGRGSGFIAVEIPFTPRAKRLLELSWDEAQQLGHNWIGTEHLILGLIREGEGVAARVLEISSIDLNQLRSSVLNEIQIAIEKGSFSPRQGLMPPDENPDWPVEEILGRILKVLELAMDRATTYSKPELEEVLRRYQKEMLHEFSKLGFSLQAETPEKAKATSVQPKIEHAEHLDCRPGVFGEDVLSFVDGKDVEEIGKIVSSDLSDTATRLLNKDAATELQSLLQHVGSQPGVIGSVIVGNDGLLIANTLPPEMDGEQIGVWALAVYMNTQNAAKKLGHDRVYQIVSKTPRGYLVIADFGSGLLVTVSGVRDIVDNKVFEGLTHKATKTIMHALDEARRFGHNFVDTEHILLGLIDEGTGIGAKSLWKMGVNLEHIRVEVEKIVKRGSGFVADEMPFTPRAKRALELSWDEARLLGHNYVGTEHLLLGLLREEEGVVSRVLEHLGVDHTQLRSYVLRLLGESGTGTREY